jgi:CHASE2 domain-containing sensor protein
VRSISVVLAGAFMVLSSGAHSFLGWPQMEIALDKTTAGPDLIRALATGWYFGSFAMLTFGVILIVCGLRMKRGDHSLAVAARAIAACYLVFGVGAFVTHHFNPHFLAFIVPGLLAGAPVLNLKRR